MFLRSVQVNLKQSFTNPLFPVILKRFLSDKVFTIAVDTSDVIDNFTSELVQRKSNKWEMKIKQINDHSYNLIKPKCLDINVNMLSQKEFEKLFHNVIEDGNEDNIKYLVYESISNRLCPSLAVILALFDNFTRNKEMIETIQKLVRDNNFHMYINNGKFNHYLAEAIWAYGDVPKALDLFEDVYRNNIYLRRRLRLMLKFLILDVTNRSEAVLVNIIKFSEKIHKEFRDFFFLSCVWQACFLSEWFTDQTLAMELLEKHDGLCKSVVNNIPYVVHIALKAHQTDIVHRLLEVLLKYEMRAQMSTVLVALFEYRFRQGDLRSCSEIIQWSVSNEVLLPSPLQERFLMMLFKRSDAVKSPKKISVDYNLKF